MGEQVGSGRAQLESSELLFRGDFRLKIPLASVSSVEARDGSLTVSFGSDAATFDLGPKAAQWAEKIRNPRRLIDKLDVKAGQRVSVIDVDDAAFWAQLRERTDDIATEARAGSDAIVVGVERIDGLRERLVELRQSIVPNGMIWVVSPKGVTHIKDTDVMAAGIAAGLVDTKVAVFSATHTATKLVIPRAQRGARNG